MKYLPLATLILFLASCSQDEVLDELVEPVAIANMHDCHEHENWDPATVRNTLEGTWRWMYSVCDDEADFERFEGITISFEGVNSLKFFKEGELIEETEWNLKSEDLIFSIETEVESVLLSGDIFFCNNYQLATSSEDCKQMFYREL
jgi:thioredoxin reductase